MNVIVIDSEAFEALKSEMKKMVKDTISELLIAKREEEQCDWITFENAKKILPYKSKTSWQELRDKGEVEFFQDGRLILYSRKSLNEYIKKHIIKKYR